MEDGETHENIEAEWNQILEPILTSMFHVHTQIFGSSDLMVAVSCPATLKAVFFLSLYITPAINILDILLLQIVCLSLPSKGG